MAPSSPTVLLVFALDWEARPFRSMGHQLNSSDVLVTGVGRRRAAAGFQARLTIGSPRVVLNCGLAGALNPKLAVGDIVFQSEPDSQLHSILASAGGWPVLFHCPERLVVTAREKGELRAKTGADAVDLESEALREVCQRHGIAFANLRVIGDGAMEDLPADFTQFLGPDMQPRIPRALKYLLRRPRALPRMIDFARQNNAALQKLAGFLQLAWPEILQAAASA